MRRLQSQSGQASVEYVGAVLLVTVLLTGPLAASGLAAPAAHLAETITARLLCAVRLGSSCRPPPDPLTRAYGPALAAAVRAHAPEVRFEDGDYVSLPVDPRECRDRACADTSERGPLGRSFEDHPATAFSRVIDCRVPPLTSAADCSGGRRGHLYLQYWLYYPDSATKPFGGRGYHRDDWESVQIRLEPGQVTTARASSHNGYNHGPDPVTDIGGLAVGPVRFDGRKPAWGPGEGYVWVSAGSHAGRVTGGGSYFRSVPAARLRLVPLEAELRSLSELEYAVTPPWLKPVWRDPEHVGT